jgi:predicted DNA-binding transcriptional regulator YafY
LKRIERISAILIQLQSKRVVTAKEIAQRFNISIRTVYRDIRTLEVAGIPIGAEAGRGYYLVEGFLLPPVMFTPTEVGTLITAGKFLKRFINDDSFREYFDSAISKITSILKYSDKYYVEELQNRIEVYCAAGQNNNNPLVDNVIATIQSAICNKKVISIQYLAQGNSQPTCRMVEPIALGFYEHNWYLIAYCRLRNEYRNFRVDRIQSISLEEKEFIKKTHGALEQILQKMFSYKGLHRVILRVEKGELYNSIKSRYYLGFREEVDLGSKMEMTLLTDSLEILGKQLMEYQTGIEIVSPDELKIIIRKRFAQITKKYLNLISSRTAGDIKANA